MKEFIKITDEMLYDENVDLYENLVEEVGTTLQNNVYDYELTLQESIIDCESPIEQLLAISLTRLNLINIGTYNQFIDVLAIENQGTVDCGGQKYRVDFMITVYYKNQGIKIYAIECDGHEFHQKTKEQVEHDNLRQRNLQKEGVEVIRFSGSEIWNKPYKCAVEIKNIIMNNCKYITDSEA